MAMSAGQSANLMTPVLLKVGAIDTITELTKENANLKAQVTALQTALQECKDGTEIKRLNDSLTECQKKLTDCGNIVTKCAKVKEIMGQVKDLGSLEKLKTADPILNAILALAKEL